MTQLEAERFYTSRKLWAELYWPTYSEKPCYHQTYFTRKDWAFAHRISMDAARKSIARLVQKGFVKAITLENSEEFYSVTKAGVIAASRVNNQPGPFLYEQDFNGCLHDNVWLTRKHPILKVWFDYFLVGVRHVPSSVHQAVYLAQAELRTVLAESFKDGTPDSVLSELRYLVIFLRTVFAPKESIEDSALALFSEDWK